MENIKQASQDELKQDILKRLDLLNIELNKLHQCIDQNADILESAHQKLAA
ncbi:MAG: hypothetical protein PHW66_06295 [Gallionella sp.]|nr:hypothetical protein [Gallionella sp.]